MNRLIVLTGAPETTRLDWSEKSLLSDDKSAEPTSDNNEVTEITPTVVHAEWREISNGVHPPPAQEMVNDVPVLQSNGSGSAEFFTPDDLRTWSQAGGATSLTESTNSIATSEATSDVSTEFYNHSFAIQKDIPSSLLSELEPEPIGRSSFDSDIGSPITPSSAIRAPWNLPPPQPQGHLSELEDIPDASYLRSIEPQTMTVNVIVGILSISAPRFVTTGSRWGKERQTELIEVLVGDDTKMGFSITMWLPPDMHVSWKDGTNTPDGQRSALRRSLKQLRPRDIVLIRNVALGSFRGKVHGQSLRKDVTKIDLLFRRKVDDEDIGGSYSVGQVKRASEHDPQLMKVKKVRDWIMEFVHDPEEEGRPSKARKRNRYLPPDTQ